MKEVSHFSPKKVAKLDRNISRKKWNHMNNKQFHYETINYCTPHKHNAFYYWQTHTHTEKIRQFRRWEIKTCLVISFESQSIPFPMQISSKSILSFFSLSFLIRLFTRTRKHTILYTEKKKNEMLCFMRETKQKMFWTMTTYTHTLLINDLE